MKNRTAVLILFLIGLIFQTNSNATEWHWINHIGDNEFVATRDIVSDPYGNIYVIGEFDGVLDFGSTQLVAESLSPDTPDGFLAKFDEAGNFLWAVRIGNLSYVLARSIDLDSYGNIYVAGSYSPGNPNIDPDNHGPINFQSTDGTYESVDPINARDLFLAKYNSEGLLQWAQTAGGDSEEICFAYAHALAVDDEGYAVITGQFWKQLNIGTYEFVAESYGDSFVVKFDSNGHVLWAHKMNKSYHGRNRHVALDAQGGVFVGGLFEEGSITFPDTVFYTTPPIEKSNIQNLEEKLYDFHKNDPYHQDRKGEKAQPGWSNHPSEKHHWIPIEEDAFIVKYCADGNYQWARHISGLQDEQILGMETDPDGNLVLAVNYMWDISIGDSIFHAAVYGIDVTWYDMVIAKFDGEGDFLWAIREGSNTPWLWARDLAIDAYGRITVVGSYGMAANFGNDITLPPCGSGSGFVASYESDGSLLDVFNIPSEMDDAFNWMEAVEADDFGDHIISGGFYIGVTIDGENYYSLGSADAYMSKITLDLPLPTIDVPGPDNLAAEVVDEFNVLLEWDETMEIPGEEEFDLYHGDPEILGVGSSPQTHIAVGYELTEPAMITSVKSYIRPGTNNAQDVVFYIYGDTDGLPDPDNVLGGPYVSEIPNGQLGETMWAEAFFDAIDMPANTVFHVVQYWSANNFDMGTANGVPTTMNAIFMGQWMAIDDLGAPSGFILRATVATPETPSGYNIYRDGSLVNLEPISETSYFDTKLPNGSFEYFVTGVYQEGQTHPSESVEQNISFADHGDFIVNITTNNQESPQGAIVSLKNQDENPDHKYVLNASSDGTVTFAAVWTGWGEEKYDLTINHPNFSTFKAEGIEITANGGTIDVLMEEYIASPFNLMVETEGMESDQALFTWNNMEVLFEGFETNVFPPVGWNKFNLDGGTGWQQIAAGETPPGWQGGVVEPPPDGGSRMAVVTYATGGENTNDQWLVTPKIVVMEDFVLSFYLQYLPFLEDHVDIRISTGSPNDPEAFNILVDHLYFNEDSNMEWQQYSYNLTDYVPVGTPIYVAFREHMEYYPDGSPIILLDNVYIGREEKAPIAFVEAGSSYASDFYLCHETAMPPKATTKAHLGFNVYINDLTNPVATMVEEPSYLFSDLEGGDHIAGVQSVFTTGESEIITKEFAVEGIVNVADIRLSESIKVYPNPVSEVLNIAADDTMFRVVVYDIAGNMVYSKSLDSKTASVCVQGMRSGIYFLRVQTGTSMFTEKIQVVN